MVVSRRAKGVLCIVASAFGFALMAFFVRLCDDFGEPISSFQKSFFRNGIALLIAAAVFARQARASGGYALLVSHHEIRVWSIMVLRATLGTIGIFANFYAIGKIPIGEAMTLNKTAPFFTVFFAWLFLGERVNGRQLLALVLAFAGAMLVMKPGTSGFIAVGGLLPPAMWGFVSGMCAGGAYACVRYLALHRVNGALIILFFSVFSCLAAVPFMVNHVDVMTVAQVMALLGAGVGAAMGQFGITAAYRYATPSSIAVYDYSNIIFTGLLGFLFFGQVPDWLGVTGFTLILTGVAHLKSK